MSEVNLDSKFWDDRWKNDQTGWDLGTVSTPLKTYIDQLTDKDISIVIPGAGNAYEAEYLFNQGFSDITVIDLSPTAAESFKTRVPDFPSNKVIVGDFFDLDQNSFDLMIEQTFFCALDPKLRMAYRRKTAEILKPGGKLIGLLFQVHPRPEGGPPFGGDKAEYLDLFSSAFKINKMETAHNSIPPRANAELFINMTVSK